MYWIMPWFIYDSTIDIQEGNMNTASQCQHYSIEEVEVDLISTDNNVRLPYILSLSLSNTHSHKLSFNHKWGTYYQDVSSSS